MSGSRLSDGQSGRLLRAACLLGLELLSLALLVIILAGDPGLFAVANQLSVGARKAALAVAVGLTLTATVASWLVVRKRSTALPRFERWPRLLAPLIVAGVLPVLFTRRAWARQELHFLAVLLVVTLVLERCLRVSFAAWPRRSLRWLLRRIRRSPAVLRRYAPLLLLALAVATYCILVGRYTLLSHQRMATLSSDLAEFDNLFFNALKGYPFRAPAIEGDLAVGSALKVHAEFGLYLLLPFYAIRPGPEALLLIQTYLVALTAVPVYLFAARRLGGVAGVLFALAYLALPVVQRPNFYDFHFTALGMFFVAWVLFALDVLLDTPRSSPRWRRRAGWVAGLVLMAVLAREDVAIGLAILGTVVAVSGRSLKVGLSLATAATIYFVTVKFFVMPRFGAMWFDEIYNEIKAPGSIGFRAVLLTLLTNPVFVLRHILIEPKLLYVLHMTVPLAALWLRRPILLLAAAPGFFSTLLVINRPPMFMSSFQYTYIWVPYIVGASVLAVTWMGRRHAPFASFARRSAALGALCFASLSASFHYGALLGAPWILGGFSEKRFEISLAELRKVQQLKAMIRKIPPEASVAATESEGPHVSTRLVMYSLKFTLGDKPDFLLVGPTKTPSERFHLLEALRSGKYGVVDHLGPFWLAKRGAETGLNADLERHLLWEEEQARPR